MFTSTTQNKKISAIFSHCILLNNFFILVWYQEDLLKLNGFGQFRLMIIFLKKHKHSTHINIVSNISSIMYSIF